MAPVWRAIKVDLNTSLKAGGRSGQSDGGLHLRRHRLRSLLVVSELALSLMLLIGAGLLIRSFVRLQNVAPGFTTDHVLTMQVAANGPKYREDKAAANFYREIEEPHRPPAGSEGGRRGFGSATDRISGLGRHQCGRLYAAPGQELQVDLRTASTDYFRAMEIPLLKGRFFSEHDTADMPRVVIIDEKFAQRFWPHGDAVGKHLWFDPKKPITIVGVVGAVKQYGLETDGKIATYFPQEQDPSNWHVPRCAHVLRRGGAVFRHRAAKSTRSIRPSRFTEFGPCRNVSTIRWRASAFRARCWAHLRHSRCCWPPWVYTA